MPLVVPLVPAPATDTGDGVVRSIASWTPQPTLLDTLNQSLTTDSTAAALRAGGAGRT